MYILATQFGCLGLLFENGEFSSIYDSCYWEHDDEPDAAISADIST